MSWLKQLMLVVTILFISGCTGKPEKVSAVQSFNLDRYLGTWYEIARLDHSFERGLSKVSAQYSINDDSSVKVVNRGWKDEEQSWSEAIGKAKFVGDQTVAHLKVSFFGPFYGSYVVFYLEDDYSVALVSGYNTDYFWILSRTPSLPESELAKYLSIASEAGFDTDNLIFPQPAD